MWRNLSCLAVVLSVALLGPATAGAEGDPVRGKALADTCKGCHFIPNYKNSYPVYKVPMLGGQNEEYVVIALKAYAGGERGHQTMHSQAASMTEQDMADIAAYLGAYGDIVAGPPKGEAPAAATTCAACHGERGMSVLEQYPHLAGQHASYLSYALEQYRSGARKNAVMAGFATQLSDADIESLAAFFAAQQGLFTPER